ncbi:MAG: alpha/beta hydrolase [Bdellovibrionales bacterium]
MDSTKRYCSITVSTTSSCPKKYAPTQEVSPHSELVIDDRAGHHPMEDHPTAVLEKLIPFLKSVDNKK